LKLSKTQDAGELAKLPLLLTHLTNILVGKPHLSRIFPIDAVRSSPHPTAVTSIEGIIISR
jgi:hypothetical protein